MFKVGNPLPQFKNVLKKFGTVLLNIFLQRNKNDWHLIRR